jgi:hypothetical protein
MIERINKNRDEQNKEFEEVFRLYANPNCKYCLGTGKEYWIVDLSQYKICECVLRNVEIERVINERGQN